MVNWFDKFARCVCLRDGLGLVGVPPPALCKDLPITRGDVTQNAPNPQGRHDKARESMLRKELVLICRFRKAFATIRLKFIEQMEPQSTPETGSDRDQT